MRHLFSYQSIATKIVINALFLLIMISATSGYSWYAMTQIGGELETITEQDIPLTNILTRIAEHQLEQSIHLERALRYGDTMLTDKKAVTSFESEINQFDALSDLVELEINRCVTLIDTVLQDENSLTDANELELERVNASLFRIEKAHAILEGHTHQVFDFFRQNRPLEAQTLVKKVEIELKQLKFELKSLLTSAEIFTKEAGLRADEHKKSFSKIIILLGIISLIVGGLTSWSLSRWLINRLSSTQRTLERISTGNLSEKIDLIGNDEITKLQQPIVKMQQTFLALISQIEASTIQLSQSSQQVAKVMQHNSVNILQQQSDTEQVSNAMDNMITTVRDMSESVAGASGAANKANTEAHSGQKIVEDTVNGVENLARQIETTATVVSELERDSENINTVLDVIKGIAEKTNLLALNAAIEAARAGEQGRGFAVVADEVRTLAGRTKESTAEINQIIEKLQSGARKAVAAMNESREKTQDVVTKASLAGTSLATIATSVAKINETSSSIAMATETQNEVSVGMSTRIRQLSDMTLTNTGSIQEVTQSCEAVATLARELQGVVEQYQVSS